MSHSSTPNLTFLTIGQAPRHDLSDAIEALLPPGMVVGHQGVLDGLTRAEVADRFGARSGGGALITRLEDGTVVAVDDAAVEEALGVMVERAECAGADIVVILCTGEFPSLRSRRALLVEPDALVTALVGGLLGRQAVGIVVPMADQISAAQLKWKSLGDSRFAAASPYAQGWDHLVEAGCDLVADGARALVLDCMGYGTAHVAALRGQGFGVPVLATSQLVASALTPVLA